jgi:hypothetical protein
MQSIIEVMKMNINISEMNIIKTNKNQTTSRKIKMIRFR